MKIRNAVFAKFALATLLGLSGQAQAQWNAYNDFYLSPGAAGWTGATSPTALGTAWGYYMGNVNGYGLPTGVGSYISSERYRYSNHDPLSAGGPVYSTSLWGADGGGAGFARYQDNVAWGAPDGLHSSLGRYDNPWFSGAPGLSQGLSNLIWLQSVWLGGGSSEGIASMLTWTAPSSGLFSFNGLFVSGDQALNSAAVAIVDSTGGGPATRLARTVLANDSIQNFSFMANYNAGDVVQFQVGNNYSTGNAVGLQVTATSIPEPSSGLLLTAGLGALGLVRRLRRQA